MGQPSSCLSRHKLRCKRPHERRNPGRNEESKTLVIIFTKGIATDISNRGLRTRIRRCLVGGVVSQGKSGRSTLSAGFQRGARVKKEVTSQDLTAALSSGMVSPANFLHHLNKEPPKPSTSIGWPDFEEKLGSDVQRDSEGRNHLKVIEALRAVPTTTLIYPALPNATMALSIIQQGPLFQAQWVHHRDDEERPGSQDPVNRLLPYHLSRPATFACVAMFESGGFDLKPDVLNRVMAVSAEDSIYVAAPVLCDPAVRTKPHKV